MTTASFHTDFLDAADTVHQPTNRGTDDALNVVLARRGDRLLRDAGLTREGLLGIDGAWWHEQRRTRSIWDL